MDPLQNNDLKNAGYLQRDAQVSGICICCTFSRGSNCALLLEMNLSYSTYSIVSADALATR